MANRTELLKTIPHHLHIWLSKTEVLSDFKCSVAYMVPDMIIQKAYVPMTKPYRTTRFRRISCYNCVFFSKNEAQEKDYHCT